MSSSMEVAASIRNSLPKRPKAAPDHLQLRQEFYLPATRPSSRCPLPPPSVLHLDLEHGDSCTQRPWHLARHQLALCRASPPVFWGAVRALCASGSEGTTRCTQVSAPPRALSVGRIAAERNTGSTTCSSTPGRGLSSVQCSLSFMLQKRLVKTSRSTPVALPASWTTGQA